MSNRAEVIEIKVKGSPFEFYLRILNDTQNTLPATYLIDFLSKNDHFPVRMKQSGSFLHVYFLIGTGYAGAEQAAEHINKRLAEIDQFLQEQTKQPKQPRWKVTANIITDRTGRTRNIKTIVGAETEQQATDLAYKDFNILDTERINYVCTEKL